VVGGVRAALAIGVMVLAVGCRTAPQPPAPKIAWKMLRGLDYKTGKVPDEVKRLDGTVVQIAGYMVARHQDTGFQMTEFLLVPYPNTSSDFPPPPPNEIVLVKMDGGSINYSPDALWFQGRFTISPAKSPWGPVTYQLSATATQPYKETAP
jgi:hypothetical protein